MEATKNDILNAQNSSIAIIDLTEHMFRQYHLKYNVTKYVNIAIESGEYYGMRSQITHLDKIIPDITKEKSRKNRILNYFYAALVLVFLIYITYIVLRYERNRKLLKGFHSLDKKGKNENNLLKEEKA